jgi:hypothetical protein
MIAKQTGNNCVNRALSTMRLALGYEMGTPLWATDGEKATDQIVREVGFWFPKHKVIIACGKENVHEFNDNCEYIGNFIPGSFNWDDYLVAFSYYIPDSESAKQVSHFVIGVPALYGDMKANIAVCVELPKED